MQGQVLLLASDCASPRRKDPASPAPPAGCPAAPPAPPKTLPGRPAAPPPPPAPPPQQHLRWAPTPPARRAPPAHASTPGSTRARVGRVGGAENTTHRSLAGRQAGRLPRQHCVKHPACTRAAPPTAPNPTCSRARSSSSSSSAACTSSSPHSVAPSSPAAPARAVAPSARLRRALRGAARLPLVAAAVLRRRLAGPDTKSSLSLSSSPLQLSALVRLWRRGAGTACLPPPPD